MPEYRLTVNGQELTVVGDGFESLLGVIRGKLHLLGTKYGCGEGECGACTVLLGDAPTLSCQLALEAVGDRPVTTIEGIAASGGLHPVQAAFLEEAALQCGYCTPGMVMAAVGLLRSTPSPDDSAIRRGLAGNLCRCGAYSRVARAVHRAAEGSSTEPPSAAPMAPPLSDSPSGHPIDLTPVRDRRYFDFLGDGLVAVLPPGGSPHPAFGTPDGGAFLHLGSTGRVTAFIGKVDGGQDNRSALTQMVAEELRVAPEQVTLVMGDTDISPFDVGTFGSRSTPDAGLHLRLVGAAARARLLDLASQRLECPVDLLTAASGVVGAPTLARRIDFADLVEGLHEIVEADPDQALTPPTQWTVAGRTIPRVTSAAAVSGSKRYPSDVELPGMWEGAVLPTPFWSAHLLSADTSQAEAMPGVCVLRDRDFLGVAAENRASVVRALASIRAEWSQPPLVSDETLYRYLRDHPKSIEGWGGAVDQSWGPAESPLPTSARRLSATYTVPYLAHVPMETRAAVATWSGATVRVWTGTQRPFAVRQEVADGLEIDVERVEIVVPDFGGGFGGKHTGEAAVAAARLARTCGHPVRVHWSRRDEFTQAYLRPAAVIDVQSAVGPDGRILRWDFLDINAGAVGIGFPYRAEAGRLRFQPADSPLRQGSYRALAATANNFARESHVDELAAAVGADPLDFRLQNLSDARLRELTVQVADRAGWRTRSRFKGRGMGMAVGLEKDGRIATVVEVEVLNGQVRVLRIVTGYECGAIVNPGNLANQVEGATVMGLGPALFEQVHVRDGAVANPSLQSYRVPRFTDLPAIDVVLVNRPDIEPAGAGETPIIAVAPATASAIFDAIGIRLRDLPLRPPTGG